MSNCPHCGRNLLSQASVRCNWCGAEIEDPEFRARAESVRDAYFIHQREHDAAAVRKMESINVHAADPWTTALPYAPSVGLNQRQRLVRAAQRREATIARDARTQASQPDASCGISSSGADEPAPPPSPTDRFSHLEIE